MEQQWKRLEEVNHRNTACTMNDLIPSIVETIKKERIVPTPKWVVVGKNIAFWALLGGIGVIGAIFLSLGLIDILDVGPDVFRSLGFHRPPFFLFSSTPIIWTALFGLAVVFGILMFKNTKYGYRYRTLFVGSLLALSILTITVLAHMARIDDRLDQALESRTPNVFRGIFPPRASRWSSPQDGALAGQITETRGDSFSLKTTNGEIWNVLTDNRTRKSPLVRIEDGETILVLGAPDEKNSFQAFFIRPLRGDRHAQEGGANFVPDDPYNGMRGAHDRFNR